MKAFKIKAAPSKKRIKTSDSECWENLLVIEYFTLKDVEVHYLKKNKNKPLRNGQFLIDLSSLNYPES